MKPLDSVELDRKRIVELVNEKWADKKKPKEVVVEPKVWTAEKLDDSDIKVQKVIKETPKAKPTQPSLF